MGVGMGKDKQILKVKKIEGTVLNCRDRSNFFGGNTNGLVIDEIRNNTYLGLVVNETKILPRERGQTRRKKWETYGHGTGQIIS
jgi:hypothetical protein